MKILFFISTAFIFYTYAVYPVIIVLWGTMFPRRARKRYQTLPVSVIVAARNEERNICARIENLLGQDYPPEMVEIIVVSDASRDRTVELARAYEGDRVRVIESDVPIGKAGALNLAVSSAIHDIIVFADARQRFGANVIAELVAMFYDEDVGGVSGELVIEPTVGGDVEEGVGVYWRYEKLIRRMESEAGSSVGATGSIYAIRRRLYVPLAPNTLLDDFLVPMRIVMQGFRVIFIRSARAYDVASASTTHEFARKVRTLAGNFQAVAMEPALLNPKRNPLFFQFVSHKLARLLVPYFFLAAMVGSYLADGRFFDVMFWGQVTLFGLGFLRSTPLSSARVGRVIRVSWTFTVMNAAAVMGLWAFVTRRGHLAWKKDLTSPGPDPRETAA